MRSNLNLEPLEPSGILNRVFIFKRYDEVLCTFCCTVFLNGFDQAL